MYRTARWMASFFVVVLIVVLIVSALHVTWWFAATLVALAIGVGIFAQDIVDFWVNFMLGIPAGPRHKHNRRNA